MLATSLGSHGHMYDVNMCITSCKMFCELIESFIHHCMWSWDEVQHLLSALKPLDSNDYTSQLHLYQINCYYLIHKVVIIAWIM